MPKQPDSISYLEKCRERLFLKNNTFKRLTKNYHPIASFPLHQLYKICYSNSKFDHFLRKIEEQFVVEIDM